jgi:hypothetical protein
MHGTGGAGGGNAGGAGGNAAGDAGGTGIGGAGGGAGGIGGGIDGAAGSSACTLGPIRQDDTINYDLQSITVTGTLSLAGAQIPDSPSLTSRGTLSFSDQTGGTVSFALGPSGAATYSVQLFPGVYTISLSTPNNANLKGLPPGGLTQLAAGVSIRANQTLNYNVQSVTVTGTLTFQGAAIPDSPSLATRGTLSFTDQTTSNVVSYTLPPTGPATYSFQLFPGVYTVDLSTPNNANLQGLPPGLFTQLAGDVNINANQALNYDVKPPVNVTVTGTLTLAGTQIPDSPALTSRGTISFVTQSGVAASSTLSPTGPATYSVQLSPGTYAVRFSTPANTNLKGLPPGGFTQLAAGVAINANRTLNYDLQSVTVTGTLTLNGAQVPDSPSLATRGTISFTDQTTSNVVSYTLAPTGPATYSLQLFPGTYAVSLSTPANANLKGLPPGAFANLATGVSLAASQTLNYDYSPVSFTVTGTLTLAGGQIPDSPTLTSRGTISFGVQSGVAASSTLGPTGPATYSVQLSPGTYLVRFSTPANANLKGLPPGGLTQLAAAVTVNANQTLDYDLRSVTVTGTLTLAGAQIPDSPTLTTRGTISFTDLVTSNSLSYDVSPTGAATYTFQLFPGSYSVFFSTPANANLKGLPPGASTVLDIGCP